MSREDQRADNIMLPPARPFTADAGFQPNFPPFEDINRRRAVLESPSRLTHLSRIASQESFANTFSKTPSMQSLRASGSLPRLEHSPFFDTKSRLAPNRSFREISMRAYASRVPCNRHALKPSKPAQRKKPVELLPEKVFAPSATRQTGQYTGGLAGKWEAHVGQKYRGGLGHGGVNSAKAFERMDKNRDGVLDREEALKALLSASLHVSSADLDDLMRQCDTDGDGHISFDEFESGIMKLTNNEFHQGSNKPKYMMAGSINTGVPTSYSKKANRSATDAEVDDYLRSLREAVEKKYNLLYRAFEAVDKDRNGHLSFDEVAAVVEHFGLPIPSTHVHEVFYQVLDVNQDGKVSYQEFCDKLKKWEEA